MIIKTIVNRFASNPQKWIYFVNSLVILEQYQVLNKSSNLSCPYVFLFTTNLQICGSRSGIFYTNDFFYLICRKKEWLVWERINSENSFEQEGPPAWTQEAYRPPRSKHTLCCLGGGGGGTYPRQGVPTLGRGVGVYLP